MPRILLLALLLTGVAFATTAAQTADSTSPGISVEAASIGTGVQDREPVGIDTSFGSDVGQVFCWAKIVGASDSTAATFVWLRNGDEMARVDLPVKSPLWRTWSSKKIKPDWTGDWEVRILNPGGEVLKSLSFTITAAPKPLSPTEPAPVDSIVPDTSSAGQ